MTLTWPDQAYVYVAGVAAKKHAVDDRLAFVNGQPTVRCRITINGQVVAEETNASPRCELEFTASPIPDPGGSAG